MGTEKNIDQRLLIACCDGDTRIAKECLEEGANVDFFKDCWRLTSLHHAARRGHYDIVKLLIEHGADPWKKEAFFGKTVIARTIDDCDAKMLKLMLFGPMAN